MARQADLRATAPDKNMALYHIHIKSISRADGKSATAAAAYRSGTKIVDSHIGKEFDYSRKQGVVHSQIFFPPGEENSRPELHDRSNLWNAIEKRETKANAQTAREMEFSLPYELNEEQRQQMVEMFCRELAARHRVVVDASIHAPHRKDADTRNHHVHVMFSTRRFENGQFTEKTREFSKYPYDKKALAKHLEKGGEDYTKLLSSRKNATELWREIYEIFGNQCLEDAGFKPTLDRRSYEEQGIDKEPTFHEGAGRAMANRGLKSETHERNQEIIERNESLSKLQKEIVVTSDLIKNLNTEYGELSQMMVAYEAKAKLEAEQQHRQQSELSQPELTLDSMSLAGHIRYYYDAYSQDLIKRTKLQDEALKKSDTSKTLYYMQMKYESINHCLSAQDIEDLGKTKLFIKNDKGLLDALVQQRFLSNSEAESTRRSVNNALTSCERAIERKCVVSPAEVGKTLTHDKVAEDTLNYGDSDNNFPY